MKGIPYNQFDIASMIHPIFADFMPLMIMIGLY